MKSFFLILLEFVWGLIFNKDKSSDKAHEVNKKEQDLESRETEEEIKEDIEEKQQELKQTEGDQEWIDVMKKRQSD